MIKQKRGFFQRSRIVLTALVILCGFGSFFMSMKPVDNRASRTYGVAETIGEAHYLIMRNVSGESGESYDCAFGSPKACTVLTEQLLNPGDTVLKSAVTVESTGIFIDSE